jgi:VanZ family protein
MLKWYHRKYIWFILVLIWTLLLIIVSVYPDSNKIVIKDGSDFRWDYLEHFVAYFVFGGLYIVWRANADFSIRNIELVFLFSITMIFSILTEYVQLLIPGRNFNIIDMFYNLGGVLIGILVTYFLIIRYYLRKKYAHNRE